MSTPFALIGEADFRREIKSSPRHGYLFFGEEDYLKNADLALAQKVLCPDKTFEAFNVVSFDALTYTPDGLSDALSMPPMMADNKLVVVKGVDFLNGGDGKTAKALLDELSAVLEGNPIGEGTVLIVVVPASGEDVKGLMRTSAFKTLSGYLVPVGFDKCSDNALNTWMQKHFEKHGVYVSDKQCRTILGRCGHDMFLLSGEIEKLSVFVLSHGRTTLEDEDIAFVTVSAVEYDAFAFVGAIASGQKERALAILGDYKGKRTPPTLVLGQIIDTFYNMLLVAKLQKIGMSANAIATHLGMKPYRVSVILQSLKNVPIDHVVKALALCDNADRHLKRMATDYAPIEQLICSL